MKKKLAILLSFVLLMGALIPTNVSAETVEEMQSAIIIGTPAPEVNPHQINRSFADDDVSEEEIAAEEEFWRIVQEYVDPEYFSLDYKKSYYNYDRKMTKAEVAELKSFVNDITKNDTTDLQKMRSIVEWEAENIYYDIDYSDNGSNHTNTCPYDVYKNRYTVCMGYANMANALLDYAGIHNWVVHGYTHSYNAAWSKEEKRWVIFDATWCTFNSYDNGVFTYGGTDYGCFDMTPAYLATLEFHTTNYINGIRDSEGGTYYALSRQDNITDPSNWIIWPDTTIPGVKTVIFRKSFLGYPLNRYAIIGDDVTELIFEDGWTEIDGAAHSENLKSVIIPESAKKICSNAFNDCPKLTSVTIPDGVEVIEEEAFYDDESLNSIVIGAGVEKIGNDAFHGCTKLKNITINSEKITSFGKNTFENVPKSARIKVPASVKKAYKKKLKKAGFKGKVK